MPLLSFPVIIIRATGRGEGSLNVGSLAARLGVGLQKGALAEAWGSPAGTLGLRRPVPYQGPPSLTGQSSVHPRPLPAALPSPAFSSSPPPPALRGPWITSTGELGNRTLVCFASLAPSRQHRLPAAEEGAALGGPASLPTLARLIRGGHFCPAWCHHSLIPWCPPRSEGMGQSTRWKEGHLPHSQVIPQSPGIAVGT